ncbi:MAG: glycosyl hydrolase family 18 protein [Patescibacteria group bacterium]|jgi:spore germination protein YaaH
MIRKSILILASVVVVATFLFFFIKKPESEGALISPLGKSFSIFAFEKKEERPTAIIYGYLPYWSLDKAEFFQYDKLTDIAYFGLHINADGSFLKSTEEGETEPGLNNWRNSEALDEVIKLSKEHGVRFSLTIVSHNDEISSAFLDCRKCWDELLRNTILELNTKGLKDVNLNFEYAELVEVEYAKKYTEFTKFMNEGLDRRFGNSYVVVATFADSLVKPRVTDIESLSRVADALFIMAYDFHRPSSDNAGPVAPINGIGVHAEYDLTTMLKDYLAVSPPSKLIMGVPYYGYNWVVEEQKAYAKRIPGEDEIGFSQSQAYSDVMRTVLDVNPQVAWDELGQVPYFTYTSPETGSIREVYYDDKESLELKYKLAKSFNLAGIGMWALGYDEGYVELWDLLGQEFK